MPPPVSVRRACLALDLNHEAKLVKMSTLSVTQLECVPEESLSRYLCMSKMSPVLLPSGFVTLRRAAPEPSETKVAADVQLKNIMSFLLRTRETS